MARRLTLSNHETVVVERGSGGAMGMILGIILVVILTAAVMWFVFGANMFGAMGGGARSQPNTPPNVNITVPQPEVNITVPNQQPVVPPLPSGG
jgi:hypothetical protein